MIRTLQTRFFLFLLLPVTLVLLGAGYASLMYARVTLQNQWTESVRLRLEKVAHQIQMKLDEKQNLMDLIAKAEKAPSGAATQAFLMEQLKAQPGVRSVDIESIDPSNRKTVRERPDSPGETRVSGNEFVCLVYQDEKLAYSKDSPHEASGVGVPVIHGKLQTLCSGKVRSRLSDDSLAMVKKFGGPDDAPTKRLVVTLRFDSLLDHVLEIGSWNGSSARLITRDGNYLARTDQEPYSGKRFGESDNQMEQTVLNEMKTKGFGTVLGEGLPPETIAGFQRIPNTDWYLVLISPGSEVFAVISRFHFNYLVFGLAIMAFVALLIRRNTSSVSNQIAEISAAASKVEEGDLNCRLIVDGSDEIAELKRRFNLMLEGLRQKDLVEETFGRYVDKKVADELLQKPESLRLGGENDVVTILMADLRGFTQAAEKLPPEKVIKILNRHFSGMINVIEKHEGIIVDFYGDSVLAFFNGPDSDVASRAADAVKCALEMQRECEGVAHRNAEEGLPALAMGIGIHTGEVVVGNIGSEKRAKYGIVGSPVNETDRIQCLANPGTVMISGQTYELLSEIIAVGPKCRVGLKGLKGIRELYEVMRIGTSWHPSSSMHAAMVPRHT